MSSLKKKENSIQIAIQKIKKEIRNWYGGLSVRELANNKTLVAEIEKLERLLACQMVMR